MTGMLSLSSGQSFNGIWHGGLGGVQGEVVFFTGMTGYEEVITDPSYKGQIVVFSYPLIGQYGIQSKHLQSDSIQAAGIVVSELYEGPLEKGACSLAEFAKSQNVPIMSGIDTRSVIQIVREYGTMQSRISPDDAPAPFWEPMQTDFFGANPVPATIQTVGSGELHIGLIDFHYKSSILTELLKQDCQVTIIPYTASTQELDGLQLDGLLFSNGPGDPAALSHLFAKYRDWAELYPSFGICLGHQVLASAFGATTTKLAYGHRGANHPVLNTQTGRISMSSQNHSYVVDADSIPKTPLSILYTNVNDGSIEGLMHPELPVMTVQFHPEAAPGPEDHLALFTNFFSAILQKKQVKVHA